MWRFQHIMLFLIVAGCVTSVTQAFLNITLEVKLESSIELPCRLPIGHSDITSVWSCDKLGLLAIGRQAFRYQRRFEIHSHTRNERNLYIYNVSLSLLDTYTCKTLQNDTLAVITLVEKSETSSGCDDDWYGQDCDQPCNCVHSLNTTCHNISGQCACEPGWVGLKCDQGSKVLARLVPLKMTLPVILGGSAMLPCRLPNNNITRNIRWLRKGHGFVGDNWQTRIEKHHKNEWNLHIRWITFNLLDTYICQSDHGVNISYITLVLAKCRAGTYGRHCYRLCNCSNSLNVSCHHKTGQCFCEPGWTGQKCDQECDHDMYGQNCALLCNCNQNGTNRSCDSTTGQCFCRPGWTGLRCEHECDHDMYGQNCALLCNCNQNGTNRSCDSTTGQCFCRPGWTGLRCEHAPAEEPIIASDSTKQADDSRNIPALVGVVGIIAATVIFIAVTILAYRRLMKAKHLNDDQKDTQELTPTSNDASIENSFINETYGVV